MKYLYNNQIQMLTLIHKMPLHFLILLSIVLSVHGNEDTREDSSDPGQLIKHAFRDNSMLEKLKNKLIPDLNPLNNLGAKNLRKVLQKLEPIFYRIVQDTTVFVGSLVPEIFLVIYERVVKILPEMVSEKPLHNWDLSDWSKLVKKIAFNAPGVDKLVPKIVGFVMKEVAKEPEILKAFSPVPKINL